jgi:nucleotide-binding universal stress UspA family protein
MYRRVLVPVDGSPIAELALPHAAAIAEAHHAEILLLRVVTAPLTGPGTGRARSDASESIGPFEEAIGESFRVAERAGARDLESARRQLAMVGFQGAVTEQVLIGKARERICEAARDLRADVVVMGTHGRGGLARAVSGSVADYVARHVEGAIVVLVRESAGAVRAAAGPEGW